MDWQKRALEKLDPWEWEIVHKYHVKEPHNDYDAYIRFPRHRWVYDKRALLRTLQSGNNAGQAERPIGDYIIKPRINLSGLGKGVQVVKSADRVPFGFVSQPFSRGPHLSIDYRPTGEQTVYRGRKFQGRFFLWHKVRRQVVVPFKLAEIAMQENITINMEVIGNEIIEAHLRPSLQFYSKPRFSLVVRDVPFQGLLWKPESIHDAFVLCDDDDGRTLIVNGDNLRECYEYAVIMLKG